MKLQRLGVLLLTGILSAVFFVNAVNAVILQTFNTGSKNSVLFRKEGINKTTKIELPYGNVVKSFTVDVKTIKRESDFVAYGMYGVMNKDNRSVVLTRNMKIMRNASPGNHVFSSKDELNNFKIYPGYSFEDIIDIDVYWDNKTMVYFKDGRVGYGFPGDWDRANSYMTNWRVYFGYNHSDVVGTALSKYQRLHCYYKDKRYSRGNNWHWNRAMVALGTWNKNPLRSMDDVIGCAGDSYRDSLIVLYSDDTVDYGVRNNDMSNSKDYTEDVVFYPGFSGAKGVPKKVSIDIDGDGTYEYENNSMTEEAVYTISDASIINKINTLLAYPGKGNNEITFTIKADSAGIVELSNLNIEYDSTSVMSYVDEMGGQQEWSMRFSRAGKNPDLYFNIPSTAKIKSARLELLNLLESDIAGVAMYGGDWSIDNRAMAYTRDGEVLYSRSGDYWHQSAPYKYRWQLYPGYTPDQVIDVAMYQASLGIPFYIDGKCSSGNNWWNQSMTLMNTEYFPGYEPRDVVGTAAMRDRRIVVYYKDKKVSYGDRGTWSDAGKYITGWNTHPDYSVSTVIGCAMFGDSTGERIHVYHYDGKITYGSFGAWSDSSQFVENWMLLEPYRAGYFIDQVIVDVGNDAVVDSIVEFDRYDEIGDSIYKNDFENGNISGFYIFPNTAEASIAFVPDMTQVLEFKNLSVPAETQETGFYLPGGYSHFDIEFDMRIYSGKPAFFFRGNGIKSHYTILFNAKTINWNQSTVSLGWYDTDFSPDINEDWGEGDIVAITVETDYKIKIKGDGYRYQVWMDGQKVLDITDVLYNSSKNSYGSIGFGGSPNCRYRIDNIEIFSQGMYIGQNKIVEGDSIVNAIQAQLTGGAGDQRIPISFSASNPGNLKIKNFKVQYWIPGSVPQILDPNGTAGDIAWREDEKRSVIVEYSRKEYLHSFFNDLDEFTDISNISLPSLSGEAETINTGSSYAITGVSFESLFTYKLKVKTLNDPVMGSEISCIVKSQDFATNDFSEIVFMADNSFPSGQFHTKILFRKPGVYSEPISIISPVNIFNKSWNNIEIDGITTEIAGQSRYIVRINGIYSGECIVSYHPFGKYSLGFSTKDCAIRADDLYLVAYGAYKLDWSDSIDNYNSLIYYDIDYSIDKGVRWKNLIPASNSIPNSSNAVYTRLYDDFSDNNLDGWIVSGDAGIWQAISGEAVCDAIGLNSTTLFYNQKFTGDFVFEFNAKTLDLKQNDINLIFYAQDTASARGGGIEMNFASNITDTRVIDNSGAIVFTTGSYSIIPNKDYVLKASKIGNTIRMFLGEKNKENTVMIAEYKSPVALPSSGYFGINTKNSKVAFDNIRLSNYPLSHYWWNVADVEGSTHNVLRVRSFVEISGYSAYDFSDEFFVLNHKPQVIGEKTAYILPSPPYSTDVLQAYTNRWDDIDIKVEPERYNVEWFVNTLGTTQEADYELAKVQTLVSASAVTLSNAESAVEFFKGSRVKAKLYPADDYFVGDPITTTPVVLSNQPPKINVIEIMPQAPLVGQDLICTVIATDDDEFIWRNYQFNGIILKSVTHEVYGVDGNLETIDVDFDDMIEIQIR